MTEGILGIIGCPMFADNIVYSICSDPEEKEITVTDTEECRALRLKLRSRGISFRTVGRDDLYSTGIGSGGGYRIVIDMLPLGLH